MTLTDNEVKWLEECKERGFDPVAEIQKLRSQVTRLGTRNYDWQRRYDRIERAFLDAPRPKVRLNLLGKVTAAPSPPVKCGTA